MGSAMRVLHVDDEPDFAETAAAFLEREDDRLSVTGATSVDDGLASLSQKEFDCVVSDYEMPGRNGIQFLEAVREEYPDLPFILFTGKGSEVIASDAITKGATDYLRKRSGTEQYRLLANKIRTAVEKYRTERELDQTRRLYEKVVEQSFVGTYLIQDGEFVHVNPRLADIHGYEREEILGMSPLDLIVPEEHDRVQQNLNRRLRGDIEEIQYETVGLRKDGERIDIELHGRHIEYEGAPAVIGAELDITERKEQEQELTYRSALLESLGESTIDGLLVVDSDREIVYHNEQFRDIWDMPESVLTEQTGKRLRKHISKKVTDPESFWEHADYLHEHPDETSRDLVEFADGRWIDRYSAPVRGDSGSYFGRLWVFRDVTEREERERDLERKNERLDEFASIVSHDLRNPLNVAQTRFALVCEECNSEHCEDVAQAHERMETLIDDLLTLARQGESVEETEAVDLAVQARTCWQTVETGDATLVTEVDRTIRADSSRIQQLLENLVGNSVEHGSTDSRPQADDAIEHGAAGKAGRDPGESDSASTDTDPGSQGSNVTVEIGTFEEGFYVADDGPGIPEDEREEIFRDGYSTSSTGTGFGLAITEEIAEAHGWEVAVTDSAAGGARFEIRGVEFDR